MNADSEPKTIRPNLLTYKSQRSIRSITDPARQTLFCILACATLLISRASAQTRNPPLCPTPGWSEGLVSGFMQPKSVFPTKDTANTNAPDCAFHQWSWEAFAWAVTLVKDPASDTQVPRFMLLHRLDELLPGSGAAPQKKEGVRPLVLGGRSLIAHGTAGFTEDAGAIVEADGNMMVGLNGYPVYASVHMNNSYFNTAKANLIATGDYQKNATNDPYFAVGAAVFKATWMRVDDPSQAPKGAYTTTATVPRLSTTTKPNKKGGRTVVIAPNGRTDTVTVALVGLHVVGHTENHPEFLWGTFEHNLNAPMVPDNTFSTDGTNPKSYTFYTGGTSFAEVNRPVNPPALVLDEATQKLSPVTQVVQQNATGGEANPVGPANIQNINTQAQGVLAKFEGIQNLFANYNLIGTVWLAPNTYVASNPNAYSDELNKFAFGSLNLANTTAETFAQGANSSAMMNCFLCHNATSYSYSPPALAISRIAISHALAIGTDKAVQNQVQGQASSTAQRAQGH